MNEGEIANDQLCTSALNDFIVHNGYVCIGTNWRAATAVEIVTGMVCYKGIKDQEVNGYVCKYVSGYYRWQEIMD